MERIYELTYTCGCGEGSWTTRSNYERLVKIWSAPFAARLVDRICQECFNNTNANGSRHRKANELNGWCWKAVAPNQEEVRKEEKGENGGEFDEMMLFLAGLAPELDRMNVADLEVVVHRTASLLRIDSIELFNKRGVIDESKVPEKTKRKVTKLVRSQIEQHRRQQAEQEEPSTPVVENAVRIDVRRFRNHKPARVVNYKPSKTNLV